jgi:hypothetical protein|tara:strand:+ start:2435 stop:3055 length:621 start_codon:yes stop_codon:yes gene_type:complete
MPVAISTQDDMEERIRQIIDREDTAYFSDDQILLYLEMATDEFIQQYYNVFEASQDARDKIENLVVSETISLSSPFNYQLSTLTSTYYRLLSARLTNSPTTSLKIIQLADYSAYLNDPFNKADANNPVIYQEGAMLKVLGLTTTTSIDLTYLSYTTLWSDLSSYNYEEIAQIASRKILQSLGDPRYQIMQAEILERNTILGGGRSK